MLIFHVSFWVCQKSECLTFQHIPLWSLINTRIFKLIRFGFPGVQKYPCTVPQTFFHSVSNKIKRQLLHWARDTQGNRWMGLRQMLFKVTEVCTKWLSSKTHFWSLSFWHEHSLCRVQMEWTLQCSFAAAWKTKLKGLSFSACSVLWPSRHHCFYHCWFKKNIQELEDFGFSESPWTEVGNKVILHLTANIDL